MVKRIINNPYIGLVGISGLAVLAYEGYEVAIFGLQVLGVVYVVNECIDQICG